MIWFGKLDRILAAPLPEWALHAAESKRMQLALERVAERCPGLAGQSLLDALASTGWVDRPTAERLLPTFRQFDPDRHFADYLRRLSFGGRPVAEEFRSGVRCVVEEITGDGSLDQIGPEPCVRFEAGDHQGIVLAHPEVGFAVSGRTREAILSAIGEMPDVILLVARNFDGGAAEQVSSLLSRTGVPGTLITVNLLLGLRATALRYQPRLPRVIDLLVTGGTLRSTHLARLSEREPVPTH